jgi:TolB-like protein/Tfp pilus assembly protein PilF
MMSFFAELKRRNVFRMGIAYVVVAWVLLQAVDFALDIISAPNWVLQVFFLAAVVGLPLVLIFSWVFEMTPEGIKLESQIKPEDSVTQHTSQKLDRTIITFLAFAVVLLLAERFISGSDEETPVPAVEVVTEQPVNTDQATEKVADNGIRSVAVLPFVNMSSDPEQEYFSDGLSEELLNRLAQNEQLRVAARTSSFQFKDQTLDVGEIGRQLKVDNILEGSVRKSANRLRITAQLIQVDTGYHLWSETYEREMDDVFAVQDDISLAITEALEAELGAKTATENKNPTVNLEAYQLYLQARFLLAKRGGDNILEAIELFGQATALDESFSEAWSGMAFAYSLVSGYTMKTSSAEARDKGMEAAGNASRIKPDNAEAYMALGWLQTIMDWNIPAARENMEKAYQLAPKNVDIVNIYGDFLAMCGDFEKALQIETQSIALDPLAAVHYSDLAFLMLILNRTDAALEPAQTSNRLAPDTAARHDPLIMTLIRLGKYDKAMEHIRLAELKTYVDPGFINTWWSFLYYQQGDRENLRKKLEERLEDLNSDSNYSSYYYSSFITGMFTLWLDGVSAAMPYFQKSYELREFALSWPEYFYLPEHVSNDPAWLEFWQQPGLAKLIQTRREYGPYENIGYWKEPPR